MLGEVRGTEEKGKDEVGMTKAEQMEFLLFPFLLLKSSEMEHEAMNALCFMSRKRTIISLIYPVTYRISFNNRSTDKNK